jgi:hypothetical protein
MRVGGGDTVLWEWSQYGAPNLQLSAPATAQVGGPVQVTVEQYGADGVLSPAAGASIEGATTDSNGQATLTFSSPGNQHLKATRADAVRSNAVDICVYAAGTGQCGSNVPVTKDNVPPTVRIAGIRNGARFRRGHGPRKLAGSASDSGGLFQVYFRLRRHTRQGCQWYSSKRSLFTRPRPQCTARFQRVGTKPKWSYLLPQRLPAGRYTLEQKAIDLAFNRSLARVSFTVLG